MTSVVVDASAAVKWVLPEEFSASAALLLDGRWDLSAPDLIWSEAGNVFWKKWRRGELVAEEVGPLLQDFRRFPLRIHPSEPLLETAWELAKSLERSFYDSLYLALAARRGCPLVTADRKFYDAVQAKPFPSPVLWVAELT